jgi:hypothetical protein
MYLSVPIREAKPGAVQEPHHAKGLQYQRPYWRGGHPCANAHAAVLAGKPSHFTLSKLRYVIFKFSLVNVVDSLLRM